ncbi:MAG: DUF3472 domain-containing protein [Lachnospiraceae bacterium]|nr:DUF3472 domain-containing protein [Lachnospiraceae bacterium]
MKIRKLVLLFLTVTVLSGCGGNTGTIEENDINMVLSEILESKTGLNNSEDSQAEDENEMDEETSDAPALSDAKAEKAARHAPNIYVDWAGSGTYDIISVDWCCVKEAKNTYWAVHNWPGGYAGFLNADGSHVLLMSVWDGDDGGKPTIEYVLGGQNGDFGDFGDEETGKQVYTNYIWKVGTWYTMQIRAVVDEKNNVTHFEQWIRERGGAWIKTAVISYPAVRRFDGTSMFMTDYTFNNLERSCKLNNAYGRDATDAQWHPFNDYHISGTYFATDETTWDTVQWNMDFDCGWAKGKDGLFITSGGHDLTSCGVVLPADVTIEQPPYQE